MQAQGSFPITENGQKFAWKRLDSGAVDQPRMWHAQVTQSRLYYPSQTQAVEHRHRGPRPSRRRGPDPYLSPHWYSNQLFPGAATSAWRSSDADSIEKR